MQTNHKEFEVVLCETCKGRGKISIRESAYESGLETCKRCDGQGRLYKESKITYSKILK